MVNKVINVNVIVSILVVSSMLVGTILPVTLADTSKTYSNGFERGVSWKPYIPLKRTTFVNYDNTTYTDDYAYLAAIPANVFYDENTDTIYTNPLLYYQDEYDVEEEKERSLDARQGIDYFMEDWMGYSNGYLDQMTLINVPKSKLDQDWKAQNYTTIMHDNPFQIASDLALHDWSYSKEAVVAVIDTEAEKPDNMTYGTLQGSISSNRDVLQEHFEIPQTNEVYPIYNEFTVPDGYKFIKVRSWYPCFYLDFGIPGFEGIINMSVPAGDRDMQIYCEQDGDWMMAAITSEWNAQGGMDIEKTSAYVYKSGKWRIALTDVPTKDIGTRSVYTTDDDPQETSIDASIEPQVHRRFLTIGFGRYGSLLDVLKNMRQVTYQVDIEMYPGVTLDIPESPPYGCRNAQFELTWNDPSVDLGISLIGPAGEEVLSTREEGVQASCHFAGQTGYLQTYDEGETGMIVERLGELKEGEAYSLCVFATNELSSSVDFSIQYSWEQNYTREEGDGLASASEGAILASIGNMPLLYTEANKIAECTKDALYQLGVKQLYVIDLGGYLSSTAKNELKQIGTIKNHFTQYDETYSYIRDCTGKNDVIFTTIDPWSYWYVADLEIAGEMPGALALGPATFLAAQHGSPTIIIDNHAELSSAVVWHNELWQRHPDGYSKLPTVSEMYLTGKRIYNFLKDHDYDKEGMETIITLGGQFDIGLPWDRVFVGKGKPGRFLGSPTDLSVWVSKTVFYPQIVFQNPAADISSGGAVDQLINGSSSRRRFPWRGSFGLQITKPSQEETFQYPVLDTLICYDHKFNTRASKYWGFTYKCADESVPGITQSLEPIDEGVMIAVNGQEGGYLADLSGSEVQPFYLKQAGYDPVFSTNFDANMHNLNQGVLLWLINTHGGPQDGGMLMFWDVESEYPFGYPAIPFAGYGKETNPWRGYEWLLGSTDEPDTMTSEIHGILPALLGNPNPQGIRFVTTALDWAAAIRPIRDIIGKLANLPILRLITPEWLKDTEDYHDGVIITVLLGRFGTSWCNGSQIDDSIGNIHSTGISSVACLPAGKYLHLTLMRHGSVFQIMDPWATSWYSDVWQNGVPRGIALGQTIGEIYAEGISKVGILYITEPPQWWWDLAENVCLYGDPDLRIWVPSTEFSSKNNWEPQDVESLKYSSSDDFFVDGHMPFGVTSYPKAREPEDPWMQLLWIVVIVAILSIIIIGSIVLLKGKK